MQINPRFSLAHVWLVMALGKSGRIAEAQAAAQRLIEIEPSFTIAGFSSILPDHAKAMLAAGLIAAGLPP